MSIIQAHDLARSETLTVIDDVVYLPAPLESDTGTSLVQEMRERGTIERVLPQALRSVMSEDVSSVLFWMEHAYREHLGETNEEPPWFVDLPQPARRFLRRESMLVGTQSDAFAMVPNFPRTQAPYVVRNGGFVAEAVRTFGVTRLSYIRQLAFLHDPIETDETGTQVINGTTYTHTRYAHVLDVMAIATLMGTNVDLSRTELMTLRLAVITHDALTPAGGDTTKRVDPQAFDEDAHYGRLLEREWSHLRDGYAIDPDLLIATVQGEGIHGDLLDLADKIAYISRDTEAFVRSTPPEGLICDQSRLVDIQRLLDAHPTICDLWDAVRVRDGRVCVADGDRLTAFLTLRAHLFRSFYHHAGTRFLEFLLSSVVITYLYETGRVTVTDLLTWTDEELERTIAREFDLPSFHLMDTAIFGTPLVESFPTEELARARERELIEQEQAIVFVETFAGRCTSGTHLMVEDDHGRVRSLADVDPDASRFIEETANVKRVTVYAIREPHQSRRFAEALHHERSRARSKP